MILFIWLRLKTAPFDTLVELNTENSFVLSLANAEYNWNISCNDSKGNLGNSESRTFRVNYVAPPPGSSSSGGSSSSSSGGGNPPVKPNPRVTNNTTDTLPANTKKINLEDNDAEIINIKTEDFILINLYDVIYDAQFEVAEEGVLLKILSGNYLIKKDDLLQVLIGGSKMYVGISRVDQQGAGVIIGLDKQAVQSRMGISSPATGIEGNTKIFYLLIILSIVLFTTVIGWFIWHILNKNEKLKYNQIIVTDKNIYQN